MNWKRTISRKMIVMAFGGVLLFPFLSIATDMADFGNHGNGNMGISGGQNQMMTSGQMHNDLDLSNVGMDDEHMTGNSAHYTNGNMGDGGRAVINAHGSMGAATDQGWESHYENMHDSRFSRSHGSGYHSHGGMMGGMH